MYLQLRRFESRSGANPSSQPISRSHGHRFSPRRGISTTKCFWIGVASRTPSAPFDSQLFAQSVSSLWKCRDEPRGNLRGPPQFTHPIMTFRTTQERDFTSQKPLRNMTSSLSEGHLSRIDRRDSDYCISRDESDRRRIFP